MANRLKLTTKLLDTLAKAPPAAAARYWDDQVPALFVRHLPSGVVSFNVQWSRTTSKRLGLYPTQTLAGAREQARAILEDAKAHGVPLAATQGAKVTLQAFLREQYAPHARNNLKHGDAAVSRIERAFPKQLRKPLVELSQHELQKAANGRLDAGASPATVNRDLTALKAALSLAVTWKLLRENPAKGVVGGKVREGITRYLAPDEERALREALARRDNALRDARERTIAGGRAQHAALQPIAPDGYGDHLTPLVLIALNTGLRRGELLSLRWRDVDLSRTMQLVVRSENAKSGRARHVALNSEAAAVLARWKAQQAPKPNDRLFAVDDPKKAWASVLEEAGIDDFRFHDLRHTFASKLVMAGASLNTVRDLLGHADIKMTLRYAHLAPQHLAAAVELLVRPLDSANVAPIRRASAA